MTEQDQLEALRDALEEACDRWEEQSQLVRPDRIFQLTPEFARLDSLRRIALRGFQSGDYCYVCGRVGSHESNEMSELQRLAHAAEDASQHR